MVSSSSSTTICDNVNDNFLVSKLERSASHASKITKFGSCSHGCSFSGRGRTGMIASCSARLTPLLASSHPNNNVRQPSVNSKCPLLYLPKEDIEKTTVNRGRPPIAFSVKRQPKNRVLLINSTEDKRQGTPRHTRTRRPVVAIRHFVFQIFPRNALGKNMKRA